MGDSSKDVFWKQYNFCGLVARAAGVILEL